MNSSKFRGDLIFQISGPQLKNCFPERLTSDKKTKYIIRKNMSIFLPILIPSELYIKITKKQKLNPCFVIFACQNFKRSLPSIFLIWPKRSEYPGTRYWFQKMWPLWLSVVKRHYISRPNATKQNYTNQQFTQQYILERFDYLHHFFKTQVTYGSDTDIRIRMSIRIRLSVSLSDPYVYPYPYVSKIRISDKHYSLPQTSQKKPELRCRSLAFLVIINCQVTFL